MDNCIFCKIINKEIQAEIVFENENVLAFYDIKPIVPVHIVLIPKKHIASVDDISSSDTDLMGQLIFAAVKVSRKLGISEGGYKLLFRVGKNGGQEVPHIHLHLLGGANLLEEIRIK